MKTPELVYRLVSERRDVLWQIMQQNRAAASAYHDALSEYETLTKWRDEALKESEVA